MLRSLVGSEMCIRDRAGSVQALAADLSDAVSGSKVAELQARLPELQGEVARVAGEMDQVSKSAEGASEAVGRSTIRVQEAQRHVSHAKAMMKELGEENSIAQRVLEVAEGRLAEGEKLRAQAKDRLAQLQAATTAAAAAAQQAGEELTSMQHTIGALEEQQLLALKGAEKTATHLKQTLEQQGLDQGAAAVSSLLQGLAGVSTRLEKAVGSVPSTKPANEPALPASPMSSSSLETGRTALFEQCDHDRDGVIGCYDLRMTAWVLGLGLTLPQVEAALTDLAEGQGQITPEAFQRWRTSGLSAPTAPGLLQKLEATKVARLRRAVHPNAFDWEVECGPESVGGCPVGEISLEFKEGSGQESSSQTVSELVLSCVANNNSARVGELQEAIKSEALARRVGSEVKGMSESASNLEPLAESDVEVVDAVWRNKLKHVQKLQGNWECMHQGKHYLMEAWTTLVSGDDIQKLLAEEEKAASRLAELEAELGGSAGSEGLGRQVSEARARLSELGTIASRQLEGVDEKQSKALDALLKAESCIRASNAATMLSQVWERGGLLVKFRERLVPFLREVTFSTTQDEFGNDLVQMRATLSVDPIASTLQALTDDSPHPHPRVPHPHSPSAKLPALTLTASTPQSLREMLGQYPHELGSLQALSPLGQSCVEHLYHQLREKGEVKSVDQLIVELEQKYQGPLVERLAWRGAASKVKPYTEQVTMLGEAFGVHGSCSMSPPELASAIMGLHPGELSCMSEGRCQLEFGEAMIGSLLLPVLEDPAVLYLPSAIALRHVRGRLVDELHRLPVLQAELDTEKLPDHLLAILSHDLEDLASVAVHSEHGSLKLGLSGFQLLGDTLNPNNSYVVQNLNSNQPVAGTSAVDMVFADFAHGKVMSVEELQLAAWRLGVALTQEEATTTMRTLDLDGSGTLDLEEFRAWWDRTGQAQGATADALPAHKLMILKMNLTARDLKRRMANAACLGKSENCSAAVSISIGPYSDGPLGSDVVALLASFRPATPYQFGSQVSQKAAHDGAQSLCSVTLRLREGTNPETVCAKLVGAYQQLTDIIQPPGFVLGFDCVVQARDGLGPARTALQGAEEALRRAEAGRAKAQSGLDSVKERLGELGELERGLWTPAEGWVAKMEAWLEHREYEKGRWFGGRGLGSRPGIGKGGGTGSKAVDEDEEDGEQEEGIDEEETKLWEARALELESERCRQMEMAEQEIEGLQAELESQRKAIHVSSQKRQAQRVALKTAGTAAIQMVWWLSLDPVMECCNKLGISNEELHQMELELTAVLPKLKPLLSEEHADLGAVSNPTQAGRHVLSEIYENLRNKYRECDQLEGLVSAARQGYSEFLDCLVGMCQQDHTCREIQALLWRINKILKTQLAPGEVRVVADALGGARLGLKAAGPRELLTLVLSSLAPGAMAEHLHNLHLDLTVGSATSWDGLSKLPVSVAELLLAPLQLLKSEAEGRGNVYYFRLIKATADLEGAAGLVSKLLGVVVEDLAEFQGAQFLSDHVAFDVEAIGLDWTELSSHFFIQDSGSEAQDEEPEWSDNTDAETTTEGSW
eukprot:TRINITY_DN28262_c0_g2_i1.p1 TRINITY_DN28262_c0_g2~~TRINITY_DN28262_c0_g2_i1.p1  ORF type:complete len:1618 (-),score=442.77 TRINITY_DN28262_c0_g2_i1:126-4802(-)